MPIKLTTSDYVPPVISLEDAVKEYTIEITNDPDTKTLLQSIRDVLDSGVKTIRLKISERTGRIIVDEDCYKSICCRMVKVKKISDGGTFGNKTETKLHIETSGWHFPCPDYKYSNIKQNLERAIEQILGIKEVEVKSFSTDIVEYDENKTE